MDRANRPDTETETGTPISLVLLLIVYAPVIQLLIVYAPVIQLRYVAEN
jgi:hypothetical protein